MLRLSTALGLMALMVSTGLSVDWSELKLVMTRWRGMFGAVLVNFLGVPLLTLGLISIVAPAPAIALGFLTLSLAPGAPVGPGITGVARGDGPSAVGSMVCLGVLSVVLTPLLLQWLVPFILPGSPLAIPVREIALSLLLIQIVPLVTGLVVRHNLPIAAERMAGPFRMCGAVLLLVVVAALAGPAFRTLEMIRLRGWLALAILLAGSLALGWWSGGRIRGERIAGAVAASARNVAAALVVANAMAAGALAPPTVIAYGLLSTVVVLICAAVCARAASSAAPVDAREGLRGGDPGRRLIPLGTAEFRYLVAGPRAPPTPSFDGQSVEKTHQSASMEACPKPEMMSGHNTSPQNGNPVNGISSGIG